MVVLPSLVDLLVLIGFILVNFKSDWRLMVNTVLVNSKPLLILVYVLIDFDVLI